MKKITKKFLYILIHILWSVLLLTLVIPILLFLITGIRWIEIIEFAREKMPKL